MGGSATAQAAQRTDKGAGDQALGPEAPGRLAGVLSAVGTITASAAWMTGSMAVELRGCINWTTNGRTLKTRETTDPELIKTSRRPLGRGASCW